MPWIDCEINLILTSYEDGIFILGGINDQVPKFAITDSKTYVPVVSLSTQENAKPLDQLKSGFKEKVTKLIFWITINQKYQHRQKTNT